MKSNRIAYLIMFVAGSVAALAGASFLGNEVVAQDQETSSEQAAQSDDERFFMLNALWFKPDGGAEKYMQYMAAAGPFVEEYGGKSDGAYVPEASLIGTFDADLVFFVEWPNQKSFTDFIADPRYQAVSHLRTEAIRDSLLIKCRRME